MKVVIVEDEFPAANRLKKLLRKIDPEIEIVAHIESLEEALSYFFDHKDFDLVFMDIHLGDGLSFSLFDHLKIKKPVIFATAYDQYALEAFKQLTVDYLLKPVKESELMKALDKYENFFRAQMPDYSRLSEKYPEQKRHLIRIGSRFKLIYMKDVAYYFTSNRINYLMTFEGHRYPVEHTLDHLASDICSPDYFRINRQYIIHIRAIEKMKRTTKARVQLWLKPPLEEEIIVSTERSADFKKWLKDFEK